jgi:hypothetical protein
MKSCLIVMTFAFVVFLPSPTPEGLFLVPEAKAQSSEALLLKCRKAVFRKYGHRGVQPDGKRVRTLPKQFVLNAVDQCVANGGRVL